MDTQFSYMRYTETKIDRSWWESPPFDPLFSPFNCIIDFPMQRPEYPQGYPRQNEQSRGRATRTGNQDRR